MIVYGKLKLSYPSKLDVTLSTFKGTGKLVSSLIYDLSIMVMATLSTFNERVSESVIEFSLPAG